MKPRLLLLSLLLPLLMPSCATRLVCNSSAPRLPRKHAPTPKDGSEEARVASYITGCTEDGFTLSSVDHIRHIPQCGMDLFATFLTLGLIPHTWPNPVHATVTGCVDGRKKTEILNLSLKRSTSLWNNFLPESSNDRAIARAVLQALRERKSLEQWIFRSLQKGERLQLRYLNAKGE
ncbi:hypothetical protein [Prosthecobacter vanneervenii]|uniref:Lipoprotein n=1 Tax=Prosthecobacter vanneervenii TaxID=48466 RepID=A0A7W7YBH9_9BACT|nr:hypothetical protein [Prosthecobacter vanneervenii]MBB5033069.1 hypothetical protein [Prosthecobacter vanneervenii]